MSSDVPPHSNTITTLSPISGMDSFKPSASSSTNSYFQLKASRAEPSAKLQSLADVTASGPNSPVPYDHQLPSQIQKDDSFQLSLMAISDISLDVGDEPLLGERSSSHADKPELTTSGSTPRHGEDAESGTIAQVLHNNETSQNARIFTSSATVDPSPTLFSRYARGGSCASEFSLQVQLGSTPDVVPSLGIKKPSRQSETLSSSSLISKDIRTLPPGASVNSGEQALPTRVFLPSERRSTTVLVESGLSRGKTRRRSSLTSDSGVEDTVRRMSTVDLRARRLSACSMQVHDGIESGSMSVCQGDSVKKRSSVGRKSTAGSRVQGRGSVINVAEPAEALSPGKGKDQKGSQRLVQLAVPQEPLIPKTSSEVAVTSESILPPPSPSNSSHHLFNKLLSRCRTLFIDPIHPESTHPKLWMAWKTLIFFAHIIAIILTPLQMGWSHYILSLTRIALGQVLFDVILFIDAYLDARVVFDQDGDGNFCWDGKEIWRRFAYSNFGLGRLLLSLPFQLVAYRVSIPENWFRVYGLNVENTLTFRRKRLFSIITFCKTILRFPVFSIFKNPYPYIPTPIRRVVKSILFLLFLSHIDCCLFWTIDISVDSDHRWIDHAHLVKDEDGGFVSMRTQYLEGLISAIGALNMKSRDADVGEDVEHVMIIVEFALGVLMAGAVTGTIENIAEGLDLKSAELQRKEIYIHESKLLQSFLMEHRMPPKTQRIVMEYRDVQWELMKELDEEEMFEDLPKDLIQQTKNHLYLDMVRKVPLFSGMDEAFFNFITLQIKPMNFVDECYIFRKGDPGNDLFIIKIGQVEIVDGEKILVVLQEGACFGEVALYKACTRTASARARGRVVLCGLNKESFWGILRSHPEFEERVNLKILEQTIKAGATTAPPASSSS